MFGLMKPCHCRRTSEQKREHRLHYCGTCKTLGRLYGQRTRFLLNYDTVFLAELLTSLSGASPQTFDWDAAYHSKNCFRLPAPEAMPLALQFAATANVVLTEFKLSDRINDSGQRRWAMLRRVLDAPFKRAAEQLIAWRFPLAQLWQLETLQTEREANWPAGKPAEQILDHLAEPTAVATAMFFDHGARLIEREAERPPMAKLGVLFGRLVYLLDAAEDYEHDLNRGEFNAIRAAYGLKATKLISSDRSEIEKRLIAIRKQIVQGLQSLPIAAEQAQQFAGRLQAALWDRLSKLSPVQEATKGERAPRANSCWERCKDACGDCCCEGCAECGCDSCCECGCDGCCDGCCDCSCDC
ncbi:MAG TPA: DUF5685 family protein [Blastocatellia bacterium]|nr:DUF5685 family protein [Blastocatellia bacterium]HMX30305.1 DUF5685 family protein [Blastocatellia bacterium]HMY72577.1 DUF5685 family protein [Blastocatellia bacterium]HMZ21954.1 DUF5685 family protein [Blastocatellia bacterium]HNG32011.1 DUF5685 family protein [Blastocatellia bacterium]